MFGRRALSTVLSAAFLVPAASHAQVPCAVTTVIGNGFVFSGDGGPVAEASFYRPSALATDSQGRLYIADSLNYRIRRVDSDGTVRTIAGSGEPGDGASGPAMETALPFISRLAVGPQDRLYLLDQSGARVWRIDEDGMLRVVAGSGSTAFGGDGGPATSAGLIPNDIAVNSHGDLLILDAAGHALRRVDPGGTIDTIVGGSEDGGVLVRSSARLERGPEDRVFFTDASRTIRSWSPSSGVELIAGGGSEFPGDEVDLDPLDSILPRDIGILAWSPSEGLVFGPALGGKFVIREDRLKRWAGPAGPTDAEFLDGALISAAGNRLRVTEGGESRPFGGFAGQDWLNATSGSAIRAVGITGMSVAPDGRLFIATGVNGTVHALSADGSLSRVAGIGSFGEFAQDGTPALDAALDWPWDVDFDANGDLLIAEQRTSRIRRLAADGTIQTAVNFGGMGGPSVLATSAEGELFAVLGPAPGRPNGVWRRPVGMPADLPADSSQLLPRRGTPGRIDHMALLPDGSLLTAGVVSRIISEWSPNSSWQSWPHLVLSAAVVATDPAGIAYIGDNVTGGIWRRDTNGRWESLTPLSQPGRNLMDGASLRGTPFDRPAAMASDRFGTLYVFDRDLEVVRRIAGADRCPGLRIPLVARNGVVNGASFRRGGLAPGLIVSVFGENLGPDQVAGARIGDDGRLLADLAGVRVLIGGQPAPLLFVSRNQLGAIVPFGVEDLRAAAVAVEFGGLAGGFFVSVIDAQPGLFTLDASGRGQAAALNQDGSLNTLERPAKPGEIVVLFATGAGQTNPPSADGEITGVDQLPVPLQDTAVFIKGVQAEVLYSGAAPGLVAGVVQVNARLPEELSPGTARVELRIGSSTSLIGPPDELPTIAVGL